MIDKYKVYKNDSYELKPCMTNNKVIKNAYEILFTKLDSKEDLCCGIFKMTENSVNITFPQDEAFIILKGEYKVKIGKEIIELREKDIFHAKKGLKATLSTNSYVELFFTGYPVE